MEQEMDHLQRDYRLIEDGYGSTMLNLVVAKGYAGCSPTTGSPATWERNHLDMKRELDNGMAGRPVAKIDLKTRMREMWR